MLNSADQFPEAPRLTRVTTQLPTAKGASTVSRSTVIWHLSPQGGHFLLQRLDALLQAHALALLHLMGYLSALNRVKAVASNYPAASITSRHASAPFEG